MNNSKNQLSEMAIACFSEGFCCSQAILSTFSEKFNLDKNIALKLSDSFGGGMGRMALTCGAVTGAFMVIGLKYGRISAEDEDAKQKTGDLVQKFIRKFETRNTTISCKELLACDISADEGLKYAQKHNLIKTICPKFIADAVEILEEIL
jgi:C_GCAxxG_C_C family probable redox protein